ncbi:MAG: hypothetical protein NT107_15210 [Planctomycetota bacterium]|nr:hypothetical protein [Planctomycetota bacterium]
MTHARLWFSSLLLIGTALVAQSVTTQPLRIGTWNLEFLGAPGDFRNKLPMRDEDDFRKLGQKVRELGVSVLAVQEISGEAPLQKVTAAAGPSWRMVLGTTGIWENSPVSQSIGFLYDTARLELLTAEELLFLPRELEGVPIFHRVPVTATFRDKVTGFDFRLVTVHLKAGQKEPDLKKRELEALQLKRWLDTLLNDANEDQDIAVLGDFNSSYGAKPQQILEQGSRLHYLVPKEPLPTIMHFPEQIDQVVFADGFNELRTTSFTVDGDFDGMQKEAWRKTYSDHFPVTVEIACTRDEDPQAKFWRGEPQFALPKIGAPNSGGGARAPKVETVIDPAPDPAPKQSVRTKAAAWPFVAGQMVQVSTMQHNFVGLLKADVPKNGMGWVVLEVAGLGQITIACAQVTQMSQN